MQTVLLLCLLTSAYAAYADDALYGNGLNLPPQALSQDRYSAEYQNQAAPDPVLYEQQQNVRPQTDASTITQLMEEMPEAGADTRPVADDDRFAARNERKAPAFGAASLTPPKNVPANYIPQGTKSGDPLDDALGLVSEQIVNNAKKMHEEKGWVTKVGSLVEEMQLKVKKVKTDVEKIRQDTVGLLKKKRQIENAKLQKKLNDQLKAATEDKDALETAIQHVKVRTDDFVEKKSLLVNTIGDLQKQIKTLQGVAKDDEKDGSDPKTETEKVSEQAQATLAEFSEEVSLHNLDRY